MTIKMNCLSNIMCVLMFCYSNAAFFCICYLSNICYFFVRLEELKNGWSRDKILNEINLLDVPCYTGACPEVYLEKAFDNTGLRPKERSVNAKKLGEISLMFLVHPTLSKDEIHQTCKAITSVMKLATK